MSEREASNIIEPILVRAADVNNAGVTGATVNLIIQRTSDNKYWNGASFQVGATSVTMTEWNASQMPGIYLYLFNTSGLSEDNYIFYATSPTAAVITDPWFRAMGVGGWPDKNLGMIVESVGGYTAQQVLSIGLSILAGVTSGGGLTFKTPDGSTVRGVFTVDANDNRTASTLTPST